MSTEERRGHTRIAPPEYTHVLITADGREIHGSLLDVSASGAGVRVQSGSIGGDVESVQCTFAIAGLPEVTVDGRIVRTVQGDDGIAVGIEFNEVNEAIATFVDAHEGTAR